MHKRPHQPNSSTPTNGIGHPRWSQRLGGLLAHVGIDGHVGSKMRWSRRTMANRDLPRETRVPVQPRPRDTFPSTREKPVQYQKSLIA